MNFETRGKIVIQTLPYLPEYTLQEIMALGFEGAVSSITTVETTGTLNDCILLNLKLFTAGNVLWNLHSFKANSIDDVYKGINAMAWEEVFGIKSYFTIDSYSRHPDVRNKMFMNVKCKDAIADRFNSRLNMRPDSGPEKNAVSIYIRWVDDEVTVFIDTSGNTLSKHNYRVNPFKAPMNEALSAAVILASAWNRKDVFINPMCGSGTLAIEAVLLAQKKYPALERANYAFMHLTGYNEGFYKTLYDKLRNEITEDGNLKIIASDNNSLAIEAAKENAKAANVFDNIEFHCCDFNETPIPEGDGVVLLNPPYGERMESDDSLKPLYKEVGDFLKQKCQGKTGFVFTGNPEAAKAIGLKPSRRFQFMNASIECRLFKYELYAGTKRTFTSPQ